MIKFTMKYWSAEQNEGEHNRIITITIDPEKLKILYLEITQRAEVVLILLIATRIAMIRLDYPHLLR